MSLADQLQRVIYKLKTEGAKEVKGDFVAIDESLKDTAKSAKGAETEINKLGKTAANTAKEIKNAGKETQTTEGHLKRMSDVLGRELVGNVLSAAKSFGPLKGAFDSLGVSGDKLNNILDTASMATKLLGGPAGIIAGLAVGVGYAIGALGDWQHEMNQARFVQEQFAAAQQKTKDAVTQGTEAVRMAHLEMAQLSIKTALGTETMEAFTRAFLKADAAARASSFRALFQKGDAIDQFNTMGGMGAQDDISKFTALTMRGKDVNDTDVRASERITERLKDVEVAKKELDALERQWKSYEHGQLSAALYRQEGEKLRAVIDGTVGHTKRDSQFSDIASMGGIDRVGKPLGWSPYLNDDAAMQERMHKMGSLGVAADTTQRNKYGAVQDEGDLLRQVEGRTSEQLTERWKAEMAATNARRGGYLETAFGPIEQFDVYKQSFESLGSVFSTFGEAVGASYTAIVTGQGSVTAAFRNIMADGMMALGKSSVIHALSETALGFGSLALGPIGGVSALAHFKSAALHGAVAVAAGLAANAMGAGSGGGGGGGGAAAGAAKTDSGGKSSGSSSGGSGGTSGGGDDKRTMIIVYGDSFAEDSPRMRQLRSERLVKQATGGAATTHS